MKNILYLSIFISLLYSSNKVTVNNHSPSVSLISSNVSKTVLEFNGGDFSKIPVSIEESEYFYLTFQGQPTLLEKGNPQLPKMVRSIVIPDNAKMKIQILESDYVDFKILVAPSKGSITRNINPSTVPYTFSNVYQLDEFYPRTLAELSDPYILRDIRGIAVTVYPFRYNPVSQTLRVYTKIVMEVIEEGMGTQNIKVRQSDSVNKHFTSLYSEHFINFDRTRYETVEERGRMIVITYGDFMNAIQPYVDWKNQKGIRTDLYDVYDLGANATGIKNFIQSQYDQDDGLCFVQLVGDHAQVPTIMVSNGGGGGSDPSYSLLEGNDDYPEIFVGRFSASTLAHVETQVERTIHYERDIDSGSWLHKGSGFASNQGPGDDGEYDQQHSANIRDKLLDYTYTEIDEVYDPSGSVQQGVNAINNGRSVINYTGHGSETSWGNGAPLNNNDVNGLTNDGMLPHVISVGCVNGAFENITCFGEAWLRATNNANGNPTGAVAFYASTVNQYWNEPMRAQDHAMDLLVGHNYSDNQPLDKKYSIGGLWYNGSCNMMDVYGQSGIDMFLTWIVFGDVSLDIRSDTPTDISVYHNGTLFIGNNIYEVSTNTPDALVGVSEDGTLLGSGYTDENGDLSILLNPTPTVPTDLTLTLTGYNKITTIEPITVLAPSGPYVVLGDYSAMTSDDNVVEFGEDVTLSVTLENIGIEIAMNVIASFNSFDPYISIDNESTSFGSITPNSSETVSSACTFVVSDDIPDNHLIQINVSIQSDTDTWEEDIIVMAFAPVIEADGFTISNDGNGNGNLDPGESASLNVTVRNGGGADAHNVSTSLSSSHPGITITQNQGYIGTINDNSSEVVSYSVSASSNMNLGEGVTFELSVSADDNYDNLSSFVVTVGLALEDFESGNFSSYPWQFSGYSIQWPGIDPVEDYQILDTLEQAEWDIDSGDSYSGSFNAKSASITHNQASVMHVTLDIIENGDISFYYRVACEYSPSGDFFYDGLIFSIDGETMNWFQPEGTGQSPWTFTSFPVSAGLRTFSWAFVKDNSDGSTYIEEDAANLDYIIFPPSVPSGPSEMQISIDYMTDWNMVGIPLIIEDSHYESLFLNAIENTLYSFDDGYSIETELVSGMGYLLRLSDAESTSFSGLESDNLSISLSDNWNLISGISYSMSINAIEDPDNLIIPGTIYGFEENGYSLTETIEPGKGYWLRSVGAGEITLSSSAPIGRSQSFEIPENMNSMIINNSTLYFGEQTGHLDLLSFSLPPKLPAPSNDIRFSDDTKLCSLDECMIEVMNDGKPLEFDCEVTDGEFWEIVDENGNAFECSGVQVLEMNDGSESFVLRKSKYSQTPIEFALLPAHPNPFNPVTTIRFSIPDAEIQQSVFLRIYDVTGKMVKTLVDEKLSSGNHNVRLEAGNLSSGVYFLHLKSGNFSHMEKLMLIK